MRKGACGIGVHFDNQQNCIFITTSDDGAGAEGDEMVGPSSKRIFRKKIFRCLRRNEIF